MYFATNSGLSVNGFLLLLLLLCLLFGLLLLLLGFLDESPHTPSDSISLAARASCPLSGGPMSSLQERLGVRGRRGEGRALYMPGLPSWGKPPAEQSATEAQ